MKKAFLISLLLALGASSRAQTLNAGQLNAVPLTFDGTSGGTTKMYIYLPWDYYTSGKKYPVIFFWPGNNGVGNGGDDLTKLLTQDLPYQINNGNPPYSVDSDGDTTRFIVTVLQPTTTNGINASDLGNWTSTMKWLVGLRTDISRIYYMGASQGAGDILKLLAGTDGWAPAAMVSANPWYSIPGTTLEANAAGMPIWFFQDDDDAVVGQNGTTYYNNLHDTYPEGDYKLTQFVGAHQGPERTGFFDPAWSDDTSTRTLPAVDNTSMYDWLMKFSKPSQTMAEFTINIGNDTTVSTTSMTFGSTVVHMDGNTLTSTSTEHAPTWKLITKASSGAYVTGSFYALNTKGLANLNTNGDYTASLTMTNDYQVTKSDTIKVTKVTGNVPPVANAGSDQSLDHGTTSATLSGSGTDADGTVASYSWSTSSGATITSPTSASTTVTGLSDGNSYTFTLTVTDDGGATGTDNMTVTVAPAPLDTPSYQILLSQDTKFWDGDTIFYQFVPITGGTFGDSLIDEQTDETPTTRYWTNYTSQMDYPNDFIIDLGGLYKITRISFYSNANFAYIDAIGGTAPYDFYDTLAVRPLGNGVWSDFNDTMYTRFLKVGYDLVRGGGNQQVNEMRIYGHVVGDSLSRVNPNPPAPTKTPFTMGKFMGFNQVGPQQVDSVGSLLRHYQQQAWIDTVTMTHNIDSILFVFTKFGHRLDNTSTTGATYPYYFPYDYQQGALINGISDVTNYVLHQMALDTSGYFDAMQGVPVYAGSLKPIDTVNHHSADATDPSSYDRLSRMMWNYAAYYGSRTHPADSIQDPYPELSGLGLRAFVEEGNEMNADWSTRAVYYTPEEYLAYASAFYDGNSGQMGSRMGVKAADSSMIVIKAGTAGTHVDRLRMINFWTYYKRKDKKPPFDILNVHTYPSNGTNGGGTNKYAYTPEQYFNGGDNPVTRYVQAANDAFPGMPVWLTEWGYDRNRATNIAVPPIPGLDSTQIQAMFVARWWFMLSFTGISRSTMFQLEDENVDSVATGTFMSTGLTRHLGYSDQEGGGLTHVWYAYPAYYFQKTIWEKLYNYRPDSIIYENHDSIWVYRYRNADHPDSIAYAVWSGTQTNRSTDSFAIQTGHPGATIAITKLADKNMLGITSTPQASSDGTVPVTISETPQLVFTTGGTNGGQLVEAPDNGGDDGTPTPAEIKKVLLYLFGNKLIGLP